MPEVNFCLDWLCPCKDYASIYTGIDDGSVARAVASDVEALGSQAAVGIWGIDLVLRELRDTP